MKVCIKCRISKNENEFSKQKKNKDGLFPYCKECDKERAKFYYISNIEKKKKYCKNNKEQIKEKRKEYYNNNKEKIHEKQIEYKEKNKEKLQKYQIEYRNKK